MSNRSVELRLTNVMLSWASTAVQFPCVIVRHWDCARQHALRYHNSRAHDLERTPIGCTRGQGRCTPSVSSRVNKIKSSPFPTSPILPSTTHDLGSRFGKSFPALSEYHVAANGCAFAPLHSPASGSAFMHALKVACGAFSAVGRSPAGNV